MYKTERFLFSFPKFINYLEQNPYMELNKNSNDEITFRLDGKLYINLKGSLGERKQYFLENPDGVIAYGGPRLPESFIYYQVNQEDENDIILTPKYKNNAWGKPFTDEPIHRVTPHTIKLLKEYGEIEFFTYISEF